MVAWVHHTVHTGMQISTGSWASGLGRGVSLGCGLDDLLGSLLRRAFTCSLIDSATVTKTDDMFLRLHAESHEATRCALSYDEVALSLSTPH